MKRLGSILLCVLVFGLVPAAETVAQDWQVKRDPFDKRLVARYKKRLAVNPFDKGSFSSLASLYRKHRSLAKMQKEFAAKAKGKKGKFADWVVLGHIHKLRGDKMMARDAYRKALALKPTHARTAMTAATLSLELREVQEAETLFNTALANTKDKTLRRNILTRLLNISLDKGDIEAGENYANRLSRVDPGNLQIQLSLADALLSHKQPAKAVKRYQAIEKKLLSDPAMRVEVIGRLANAYNESGNSAQALKEYWRATKLMRRDFHLRTEIIERIVGIHRVQQRLPELTKLLEKKWPAKKRNHFEWRTLGSLFEETGAQPRAIDAYAKAIAKSPYEIDTHRRLIDLLEDAGQKEQALRRYEKLVKVAPGEARFHLELADRYWNNNEKKRALSLLSRLKKRMARDAGTHTALANLYVRWGRLDLALQTYKRLTKIEPKEPSHWVNLGEQYFQKGDSAKAVRTWKQIARQKNAASVSRLAQVYLEHDMLDEALLSFTNAIKLAPNRPESYRGRATVFERRKRFIDAVSDWERVLALGKNARKAKILEYEARRRIVQLLERARGSYLTQRVAKWERAYEQTPPDLSAGYLLVEFFQRTKNVKNSKRILEQMLKKDPKNLDAKHQLVSVYRSNSEYETAISLLKKLAEENPNRERDYYAQIAEVHAILHKDEDAIEYSQKALEKSPTDPVAHFKLAERYEQMQQYSKAIESYEKSIDLGGRNYTAYFAVARLYRSQGKRLKAAAVYRELFRQASNDEAIQKAGREAIDLEEMNGGLGELEKVIATLAFTLKHKDIYRRVLVELYGRYIPSLVVDLESTDEKRTKLATEELTRLGTHGVRPLLQALADDLDASQQRIAVSVLGYLGNPSAAGPLVHIAERNRTRTATVLATAPNEWDVRVEALVAAGRLRSSAVIPKLQKLAANKEPTIREAATFALGMTGSKRSIKPLLLLLKDKAKTVSTLACLGLGNSTSRQVVPSLTRVVADKSRPTVVRASCAHALGRLGSPKSVPVLESGLKSDNALLAQASAWALGSISERTSKSHLVSAYFTKSNAIRQNVLWALRRKSGKTSAFQLARYPRRSGRFDSEQALRQLLDVPEFKSGKTEVSAAQIPSIAKGVKAALTKHRDFQLRTLVDLDQADTQLSAGKLGLIPGNHTAAIASKILKPLLELSSHRDPLIRGKTASVLSKMPSEESIQTILLLLEDEVASVRNTAMVAAARIANSEIGRKRALEIESGIAKRLESASWRDRTAAARGLGYFGENSKMGRRLIPLLQSDESGFVREAAAISLGKLRLGLDELLSATSYRRERVVDVRVAALRSAAALGKGRALKAAQRVVKQDPSQRMRRIAQSILSPN